MARTVIPLITPVGPYSGIQAGWPIGAQPTATALDFVFTASGGAASPNNDQVSLPGKCLVIVNNTSGGALPVSFLSYPNGNPQGRSGDITTYSVGNGLYSAFLVQPSGWQQSDGNMYMTASAATMKYAVFLLG